MSTHPGVELAHRFFSGTGTTYDHIVHVCTIGLDLWWKKRILEKIPQNPLRIIDQACGTGILTFKIAQRFPRCHVTGVELRDEYLNIARQKAMALKLSHVEFLLGRAEDTVLDERVDCITSSYLAKYAELATLVENAGKMLRPGGLLIMHDFTYPSGRIFPRIWEFYFRILQTAGAWKYPQWRTAFYELPELLHNTAWVTELFRAMRENDFTDIQTESLTLGTSMIVSGIKKV
ncbi:MAG: class I SAM-dependent methyltransferase [Desulfobacteraceae bacterium]|jgi:demethylmenaquinone methyltransferase/2-methoxy-6-polyprenyl-1,4-benzoquinol methylase